MMFSPEAFKGHNSSQMVSTLVVNPMTRRGIVLAGGSGTLGAPHHSSEQAACRCTQTDDLLPPQHLDAGRDPRGTDHHHAL